MATTQPSGTERDIFEKALEIASTQERLGFLEGACGNNTALLKRLQTLLHAEERARGVFPDTAVNELATASQAEKPGDKIGRYKLLQKIGEGGCGVVYMAEQEETVRRKVALKVIKLGMDTRSVIARFEAERQALALMDHPNIAKVLDAGATDSGRPFFVMELVRGLKITDYCDHEKLAPRERFELFVQVCRAIQHAHQKGIIHRDIKPSNILVTLRDGIPIPKVIDFGIAKATNEQRLTDKTLFTAFEQFVGTPAYMSPEQAEMSTLDIDTRTDIYSLGVLLYELLTGDTPFSAKELLKSGLHEMRRVIREKEPATPSTRLSTLSAADLATVAQHRHTEAPKLVSLVRGDLDWIVMKSLEKDRNRRYETANGLAMDIQRHLQNEPVIARPPSRVYRFRKMVERNRWGFAAAAVVAAALVIAFAFSVWQYVKTDNAYRRALAAEAKERSARQQAERAQLNEVHERQKAQDGATRLGEALGRLELQQAEERFVSEESAPAVALLARALRRNPSDSVAAQRLLSALTCRNFAFLTVKPFKHEKAVTAAEFSPDGRWIVTVAGDKAARVWSVDTGQPLVGPLKHDSDVYSVHFSPDGQRIVTACGGFVTGEPSYAQVWDAHTGLPVCGRLTHRAGVASARFNPDGRRVLTASFDGTARIWEADSGEPTTGALAARDQLVSAQFSPDGRLVVTGSFDGTAQVWDASTGQPVGAPMKHHSPVTDAEFSPDSERVVTASSHQIVLGGMTTWGRGDPSPRVWEARVWNARTGEPLTPPLQHMAGVYSAQFSPDGLRVVTASQDKTVRIWDSNTGQPLTEPLRHRSEVLSASFSPNGQWVVTASADKTARIWDARTGRPVTEPLKHGGRVRSACFSADGERVVTASEDGTARVWDARIRPMLIEPLQHMSLIVSAHFSPEGKRIVTASYDHTARIWDWQSGRELATPLEHANPLGFAQFSPDGLRVVTAVSGGSARVWDAQTGRPLTSPMEHSNHLDFAEFSPDGWRVATASQDFTARVWDAKTGRPLTDPLQHTGVVWTARFSPDGLKVLTCSADGTARLWEAQTGQPLAMPLKHEGSVISARFSPDGLRIITASADGTARLWDAKTGQPLGGCFRHEELVQYAEFSPDGRRVVTASQDRTVRIWDAETGQPLTQPLLHNDGVRCARFSPDGQRVLTASWDKTARLWDARTGQALTEPLQHDAGVVAEFSPDGQRIVTVSKNVARVWDVPSEVVPVPAWVPNLAEVIGGSRVDDQDVPRLVDFSEFLALQRQVSTNAASDPWTRLAKWLLANPADRATSPFAQESVAQYLQRLMVETSPETVAPLASEPNPYLRGEARDRRLERLYEGVSLAPKNGVLLARLARTLLAEEAPHQRLQIGEAAWFARRAIQDAPDDPEVRQVQSEILARP